MGERKVIRVALFGLGKMGLSHLAMINAHPDAKLIAVCDRSEYLLDVLSKYTPVKTYTDYKQLLKAEKLDAVFVATPSRSHTEIVGKALDAGLHVFCEKPLCLDPADGLQLAELAEKRKLVNHVGYHYRFVGSFSEMKRILRSNVLGTLSHVRAEAYGPVVLRPKGSTWRTDKAEGGGCLYDYASHAIDLVNYLVGQPDAVSGTIMRKIYSSDVEDEVYANIYYSNGMTGHIAANWSEESYRKMSTTVTVWGANGKIIADRQELRVYFREDKGVIEGFNKGWNVRYTTDLTEPVWFYLRGEEYSAQVDHFFQAIKAGRTETRSTFRTATDADLVVSAMLRDAERPNTTVSHEAVVVRKRPASSWWDVIRRQKKPDAAILADRN
jgi:scyllo-inositol 2-dehydrogenase (NADP+)